MNGKGGGNGVYGCTSWLAPRLFARCCCSKGGNVCIANSLFFDISLVGPLDVLPPAMLEPLTISIVTEFSCLAFLALLVARSLAFVS